MGSLRDRIAVVTGASRGVGIGCDGQKIFITNGGADVHLVLTRDHDTFWRFQADDNWPLAGARAAEEGGRITERRWR